MLMWDIHREPTLTANIGGLRYRKYCGRGGSFLGEPRTWRSPYIKRLPSYIEDISNTILLALQISITRDTVTYLIMTTSLLVFRLELPAHPLNQICIPMAIWIRTIY